MLKDFAFSDRVLVRRSRTSNGVCLVEPAPGAGSTKHTPPGECRRREQAIRASDRFSGNVRDTRVVDSKLREEVENSAHAPRHWEVCIRYLFDVHLKCRGDHVLDKSALYAVARQQACIENYLIERRASALPGGPLRNGQNTNAESKVSGRTTGNSFPGMGWPWIHYHDELHFRW